MEIAASTGESKQVRVVVLSKFAMGACEEVRGLQLGMGGLPSQKLKSFKLRSNVQVVALSEKLSKRIFVCIIRV